MTGSLSALRNFGTEHEALVEYEITDLHVSRDNAVIEHVGESVFIDVIGRLADGSQAELSQQSQWNSQNPAVAEASFGRLSANGTGETVVNVKYGAFSADITVTVKHSEMPAMTSAEITVSRKEVLDRANSMVQYRWTPVQNLIGWKNKKTFAANAAVTGIPYSQTPNQTTLTAFENALKCKTDFYEKYISNGNYMPKYGNDCSGFVSISWNIARSTTLGFYNGIIKGTYKKIGDYDPTKPDKSKLKSAYALLREGDAVVKYSNGSGHTFIIKQNRNPSVDVYEQTPYQAVSRTWTYEDMSAAGYLPFTLTSLL